MLILLYKIYDKCKISLNSQGILITFGFIRYIVNITTKRKKIMLIIIIILQIYNGMYPLEYQTISFTLFTDVLKDFERRSLQVSDC